MMPEIISENPKASSAALLAFIGAVCVVIKFVVGIDVPIEVQIAVVTIILGLVWFWGYWSKNSKKTSEIVKAVNNGDQEKAIQLIRKL